MSVIVKPWKDEPNKWHVTIRFRWPDGSVLRDRKVIDAPSKAIARKWGESREGTLRDAGKPRPPEPAKPTVATVSEFAPDWTAKHARANLHKASGIDSQERILCVHILPFVGALALDAVTDEVVADLKAKWIAGGYKDTIGRPVKPTSARKTINNRLTILATLLKCAVEWKRIPAMPCSIRLLKRDTGNEAAFYEHDVYERLVEASAKLDPRYHAVILLGGDAGLRRGEIIGLDLADIDFVGGRMAVRRSVFWRKKVRYVDSVKGGTTKWVPLTPRLLAALKACRHLRGSRLLYTDAGEELTPGSIEPWIKAIERRAGLPETGRLHALRHTFCSHLAMAGVPPKTIQELARHESLTTTMRYMHLSPGAKDEGIAMLMRSREAGGKAVTRAG